MPCGTIDDASWQSGSRRDRRGRTSRPTISVHTSRTGLVFTWEDGSVLNPERLSTWFRQLRGGRAPTDQASRRAPLHSYASAGLANATGWHEVKVISERLGHANVAITIDTYSHVLPAADAETAHTLAKIILGGS
jgi:integrase